jgi:hypothetical protein
MADIVISGNTSGSVTLRAPDIAGSPILTLPTTSGTIVTTAGATSLTTSGNLTFTGTGNRITGDFSNATVANRVAFQTSTANSSTVVEVLPNGTSNTTAVNLESSSSDPANSSYGQVSISSTVVAFSSAIRGTGTYLPMLFFTGGSERLRIDTSGNVGIGTSSPVGKVDISGLNDTGGVTVLIRNTSDIGNTTPFIDLRFSQRSNGADSGRIRAGRDGIYSASGSTMDSFMAFYTAIDNSDTERMRITSGGNVLVGATTNQVFSGVGADHAFIGPTGNGRWVTGFRNSGNSTPWGIVVGYSGASPNNTSQDFIWCEDTTAQRAAIRSNGGLANYSANNSNLSDRREKTNFAPAKNYLDTICAIPVQTFNYIDQNLEEDDGLTLGVVAQDVQTLAPELVTESNWGTEDNPKMRLSIYQTDLQYALMKAIQELNAKVEAQAAEIAALKGVN